MQSQWFAIHTLSGQELKVRDNIEKRLKTEEMQEFIKEVLVPMEKVVEVRNQKKTVTTRKLHPGYVYIDMVLLDENRRLLDRPWYFIRETPGIIGFVGNELVAEYRIRVGRRIGSAALVVFSQHDRARDVALNAMRFFAHESCGQCTPCRLGTAKSLQLMQSETWDLALLNDLAQVMRDSSICGLGQAAPNPVQSLIQHFPHLFAETSA